MFHDYFQRSQPRPAGHAPAPDQVPNDGHGWAPHYYLQNAFDILYPEHRQLPGNRDPMNFVYNAYNQRLAAFAERPNRLEEPWSIDPRMLETVGSFELDRLVLSIRNDFNSIHVVRFTSAYLRRHELPIAHSARYYRTVVEAMHAAGFNSSVVITKFIDAVCLGKELQFVFDPDLPPQHLEYVLGHLNWEALSPWLYRERDRLSGASEVEAAATYLHHGHAEHLRVLLNHGFRRMFTPNLYDEMKRTMWEISNVLGDNEFEDDKSVVHRKFWRRDTCKLHQALQIFIVMSKFMMHKNKPGRDWLLALKLRWRAVANPFMTPEELETHLLSVTDSRHHNLVRNVADEYGRNFPEAATSTPRFLRHLARCAIRNRFPLHQSLGKVVQSLKVPHGLKQYILLRE